MEEIVGSHPAVAECAVIGVSDALKGQLPLGLVVLTDGAEVSAEELGQRLKQMVRSQIGAVGCYDQSLIVQRLPKTRSGKILRRTMRQIADAQPYTVPSTIDDPAVLDEIAQAMKTAGRLTT